jgi:KAP family P-loop domain
VPADPAPGAGARQGTGPSAVLPGPAATSEPGGRLPSLSTIATVTGVVVTAIGAVLAASDVSWLPLALLGAALAVGGAASLLIDRGRREGGAERVTPAQQQPEEEEEEEPLLDAPTERDEFDRARYAEELTRLILDAGTPLVVALYGAWGSGKTSLMYQIRRRLEPNYDGRRREQAGGAIARTVWFDPWMHQFDQAPAVALLHATTEQLGLTRRREVEETLKRIALALAEDVRIPYLGLHVGRLARIQSEMANDEFNRREQQARLRDHFQQILRQGLDRAPNTRLVFFIDDLDRCQPKRTVEVLEALKLYLDLPGCVYVLGVDREPLEAAIRSEYRELGITASSYLDKIVQFPFAVPAISDETMRSFVSRRMPDQLRDCTEILLTAAADDPRQVKRILHSLVVNDRLVPPSLATGYQPQILVALLLIQNLAPELYRQLRLNPSAIHELFRGAVSGQAPTAAAGDGPGPAESSSEQGATTGASLWAEHVAPWPRLAAALRLVDVPPELDLRPYLTLTAAVAATPTAAEPARPPEGHAIRFSGPGELADLVDVDPVELDSLLASARGALRRAADDPARDTEPADVWLRRQLARLAFVGRRIFDSLFSAVPPEDAQRLLDAAKEPRAIPIVPSIATTKVLPAAMLYDYPVDTTLSQTDYALCPTFTASLGGHADLATTPCWHGSCPALKDRGLICPSGFWGFRHALGHPLSRDQAEADLAAVRYEDDPDIVVGIGVELAPANQHMEHLARLRPSWPTSHWWRTTDRDSFLDALSRVQAHLVYLYCKGGEDSGVPWLRVGGADSPPVKPADLRTPLDEGKRRETRPLVVVNSGLGADGLTTFTRAFVYAARAAGVVGQDVPLPERDAAFFGERLLARLLNGDEVGWAVRDSRLDLLQTNNPLGLCYAAHVQPDVALKEVAG